MSTLKSDTLRKLTEMVRMMHAHGHGELHDRLFEGVKLLFDDTCCAFEIYGRDGTHYIRENVPFPESRRAAIVERVAEIVPFEHPAFPRLMKGERASMRMSDLISQQDFRKTHLYNEVFREAEVKHQIIIPIHAPGGVGALTLNRGGRDYTGEHLFLASLLAPQLATAYESDVLLTKVAPVVEKVKRKDFSALRAMGLTRRECEVLTWVVEGKRDSEIATILDIGVRTVNVHVHSVLIKLGVETRTAAAALVMNRNLL